MDQPLRRVPWTNQSTRSTVSETVLLRLEWRVIYVGLVHIMNSKDSGVLGFSSMRKHCLWLLTTHLQLCYLEPRALNLSFGVQTLDHPSGPETKTGDQPPREWVRVQMWSPWEGQPCCGNSLPLCHPRVCLPHIPMVPKT